MKMTQPDLKQLQLNVALARDEHAYRQLFYHFYQPLTQFAYSLVHSKEAAAEIFSDVFMKLWEMNASLQHVEHLKAYLFRSIRHASLNYLSKNKKYKIESIDDLEVTSSSSYQPEERLYSSELSAQIQKAVQGLPPKCQMVYRLIKEEQLSYKEVADVLGLSVNTIEGHMTTALKKLAQALHIYLQSKGH